MTTVLAVCSGFGGWRLNQAIDKDARKPAEDQLHVAQLNNAFGIPSALSSSTGESEIDDTGLPNSCSDLMEDSTPGDSGAGWLQGDMEQRLEDQCADEWSKDDLKQPNPPDISATHYHFPPEYVTKVEYGLKLGYREETIHAVLNQFGADICHDELLKELIECDRCTLADSRESFPESALTSSSVCTQNESQGETALASNCSSSSQLRPVVIDGSNVAMSHGNKTVFSCRGIGLAVDWFKQRGHKEITVFVPQWRKENAKQDSLITDQEILMDLERQKILVFTPSRRVNNKRIICYDDRYILNLAVQINGIVVSNDNYRDLISEKPEFKKVVEERLLMYSFVNDRFMPPDDPLGRYGPNIDSFLRKEPLPNGQTSQLCPYAKKCTYGNKCKFYHPERAQRPLVPISQQITSNSQPKIKEFQHRGCVSCNEKQPIGRTQSLGQTVSSSKSQGGPMDRSSLAIFVLAGGKNLADPKRGCSLERHSLPLPTFGPWSMRHENLRPVHSDPPRLSQLTKCTGHLALAKKLSDENYFLKYNTQAGGMSKVNQTKVEANQVETDNHHSKLSRKASLNAPIIEAQESNFGDLLAQKAAASCFPNGTILRSVTKEPSGETVENDRNNIDPVGLAGHRFVTRINSAPVSFQQIPSNETDANRTLCEEFARAASTSQSQQHKVPLQRVCISSLALDCTRAPPSFASSEASTSRNACFHGFPFIPHRGQTNAPNELLFASSEHCYPGVAWMQQAGMQNPCSRGSDFARERNNAMMPSDISSGAHLIASSSQQISTFHFGRNSSFQFVPSADPVQFFVPPGAILPEIPPSFVPDNFDDRKTMLFIKLCGLFDRSDVYRVMLEHPNEMDSKSLCGYLLQLDQQRKQQQHLNA